MPRMRAHQATQRTLRQPRARQDTKTAMGSYQYRSYEPLTVVE